MRYLDEGQIKDISVGSAVLGTGGGGNPYLGILGAIQAVRTDGELSLYDGERGSPITTEELRYGFRVSAIAVPCDEKWRTPAGVALGGPRHFGYDIDFFPVERRHQIIAAR